MPHPWPAVRYDGLTYSMDHLRDITKVVRCGTTERIDVTCTVKFSFHCFTDHRGHGPGAPANDDRPQFTDPDSDERDRVFDPKRWLLSTKLPDVVNRFLTGNSRLIDLNTRYSFAFVQKMGIGFEGPYVLYLDIGQPRPMGAGYGTVIHINSAYVNGSNPPKVGGGDTLPYLLAESIRTGKRPGKP